MDLGLKDKVALITGSSRGLGLASARSLAAEGCRVMLSARGAEQLVISEAAVRGVSSAPEAVASVAADLGRPRASRARWRRPWRVSAGSTSS